jgi:hypothetical protein
MLAFLLQAAEVAEEAEPSKTPFYILAGVLVLFAAVLSAVGTARHETWPPSRGVQRAVMLVGVLLVAGTMLTAVITA